MPVLEIAICGIPRELTCTGSGKTESFLLPIISRCLHLRDDDVPAGITAVIVYPMNALAEDQLQRMRALLAGTGWEDGLHRLVWLGLVPGTLAMGLGAAVRRWLPHHLFIYILGRGFFVTAAAVAGVQRVYAVGGAQAIAAMAYGTQSVPAVDRIVGPGNAYVAEAKVLLDDEAESVAGGDDVEEDERDEQALRRDESCRPRARSTARRLPASA